MNATRPPYNQNLDREFQRLGFSTYRDMLENGLFFEEWMSLHTREHMMVPTGDGTTKMR